MAQLQPGSTVKPNVFHPDDLKLLCSGSSLQKSLMNNLPERDDKVTLIHEDYRLDNLIFHPTETRVIAELDWELSTTGNPLADPVTSGVPVNEHLVQNVESLAKTALQLVKRPLQSPTKDELFLQTAKGRTVLQEVKDFIQQYMLPAQEEVSKYYREHAHSPQRWYPPPPIIEGLKEKAKQAGLWNLFLPSISGLTQVDYSYIAQETGRYNVSDLVFNYHPDAEIIEQLGSEEKKKKKPILRGEISSCFCMTEPDVAMQPTWSAVFSGIKTATL